MKALRQTGFLAAGLLTLVSTNDAHAESLTQTQTFSSTVILDDVSPGAFMRDFIATFDQFDPTAGTLLSVDIEGTWNLVATLDNPGPSVNGGAFTITGPYTVDGLATGISQGGFNSTGGPAGVINVPLDFSDTGDPFTAASHPAAFAQVMGTGTVDVNWDTLISMDAGVGLTGTMQLTSGSLSLTYEFEPVPEPASATLALLAGAPLLLRRRRA